MRGVVVGGATVVAVVSAVVVTIVVSLVSVVVVVEVVGAVEVQSGPSNAGSVTAGRPKISAVVTPLAASASVASAQPAVSLPADTSRNSP